jgi:hypothetical protein
MVESPYLHLKKKKKKEEGILWIFLKPLALFTGHVTYEETCVLFEKKYFLQKCAELVLSLKPFFRPKIAFRKCIYKVIEMQSNPAV